ncbi:WecB/TagA/CpsF family glycosyltransferase [Sphingomonas yunnanensis]|uniref:WecB/TagA/CpsF family glycosyltransferase n=1 Tax=Sphingomonas yunnanensis TaxID=310400 RepID=UPI001CA76297|nr:WecB/TagA/CpsF family glycosyltransferase [Sphingomonas yunnanensis]MBY9064658.1 WecB/TagA/CpsF family glycosyltransferase [Sphingomonas yunnanensis]
MRTEPDASRGFLGLRFDPLDTDAAVAWLRDARATAPFAYVVTPNVDHIVRLDAVGREDPTGTALWDAYEGATLTLCDSRVLARLARWCGVTLPVAPGSDLTVRLFDEVAQPGDRIAIIGGDSTLLAALRQRFTALDIVQHIPPMGLLRDPAALAAAAAFGRDARARFLLLAVGSPQQEIVAARIAALPGTSGVALCIGASLDFIVGRQRRAPRWLQRLGLEWAHRLGSQPRRLWRRYLVEGPRIFRLARSWRAGRGSFAPD